MAEGAGSRPRGGIASKIFFRPKTGTCWWSMKRATPGENHQGRRGRVAPIICSDFCRKLLRLLGLPGRWDSSGIVEFFAHLPLASITISSFPLWAMGFMYLVYGAIIVWVHLQKPLKLFSKSS